MPRKLYTWKLKSREIRLGERTLIVGVLNVTPDSFSDGGVYDDPDRAFARAIELEEQGADIIDIGAESTRPGSARISAAEEIRRLIPVLKRLKGELRIPISVDTYKAEVAELAIEHGAEIINDPSGFTWDPLIAKVIVQSDAGLILNHMRGTPETWGKLGPMPDVTMSIVKDLDASISRARRSGVDRLKIIVDPGLGFGKRKEQNAEILARLADLSKLEFPILVGPSHKSFLAQGTERETIFATAAAVTASILAGAHMVRVHDVADMCAVVAVSDEILRAVPELVVAEPPRKTQGQTTSIPFKPPAARLSPRLERPRLDPPQPAPVVEASPIHEEETLPPIDETEFEDVEIIGAPIVDELEADDTDVDEEDVDEEDADEEVEDIDEVALDEEVDKPVAAPEKPVLKAERSPSSRTERIYTPKPDSKRSYPPRSNDSRSGPPRSGPPRFGSRDSGSERSYPPRSGPPRSDSPRGDSPRAGAGRSDSRGSYPPRSGPPRSDSRGGGSFPPRSGPPRSDSRGSYPPRSDSRGSYPPRSGPPRSDGPPRSGPPRSDGPRPDRGSYPPRSGPPRSDGPRSYPPRSGPPRSGPPRSGPPRSGPPRSGPPRSGPPRSGPGRGPFKGGR